MNSYLCFVSESVVLIRIRQITIAGAKNVCGVSFAPLMKPCTKSFICSPVHALFKKFIPAVMFFWRHPVHRRSEQFKLMDKQINKMFEHGAPSFFCPATIAADNSISMNSLCMLSKSAQSKNASNVLKNKQEYQ